MVLSTGIDIYCGGLVSKKDVAELLKKRIPDFHFDLLEVDEELSPEESSDPQKAVFLVEEIDAPVFPLCISIFLAKNHQPQAYFLGVAQDLALLVKANCLCGYVNEEDPENPYYSILFKADGTSYLVNDEGWDDGQSFEVLDPIDLKL